MRKGWVLMRKEDFLDFAGHVEIGFQLGVFGAEFFGITGDLFCHSLPLNGIAHGTGQKLAIDLPLDKKVLGALMNGLDGNGGGPGSGVGVCVQPIQQYRKLQFHRAILS